MIQVVEVTKQLSAAKADGNDLLRRFRAITGVDATAIWQTRIFFLDGVADINNGHAQLITKVFDERHDL